MNNKKDYYRNSSIFFMVLCILSLINCAGSASKKEKIEKLSLYDSVSSENSKIELVTVDGSTFAISNKLGLLERNGNSISIIINENKLTDTIPNNYKTNYVTIIPEGNPFNSSFGVLGTTNDDYIIPSGKHIYNGNAQVFINDGNALYGLNGNSSLVLDFNESKSVLTGEITSLSGKKSLLNLSCRDCVAENVVDIIFLSGSVCKTNRICFDNIELRNNNLKTNLSKNYILNSEAVFFGPDGNEMGSIFSVQDTDTGTIEIRGATVGSK